MLIAKNVALEQIEKVTNAYYEFIDNAKQLILVEGENDGIYLCVKIDDRYEIEGLYYNECYMDLNLADSKDRKVLCTAFENGLGNGLGCLIGAYLQIVMPTLVYKE